MAVDNRISVVGLGNLGQTLAVCLAWRGFEVLGVDVNENVVASLEEGVATVVEPGVQSMLNESLERFHTTLDHGRAIRDSDITLLLVPTPTDDNGSFSLGHVESALNALGSALRHSSKKSHLFILGSTVSPGSIDRLIPELQRACGRRLNDGFEFCYCPELIALGTAARDFMNPDAVVIGESSPAAGAKAATVYRKLCQNDPEHLHMRLAEAEVAKLALNCYLALKISFGNSLAQLCEALPGVDAVAVTALLQRDRRIGRGYIDGGLPYGGPCFPRDMLAYLEVAHRVGDPAHLIKAAEEINRERVDHLVALVRRELAEVGSNSVTVLGTAFKENSALLIGSAGLSLVNSLLQAGVSVTVHDPLALPVTRRHLGDSVSYSETMEDAVRDARVVVITTRSEEYASLNASLLRKGPNVVIDCWRILDAKSLGPHCRHVCFGRSANLENMAPPANQLALGNHG